MAERKTSGRVVRLQRLEHLEEAREVLRELLEAGLVGRRLAVGHVTADGRDGNAEPVVALLAGDGSGLAPAAIFLAEIIGHVVHLDDFGREQLRQRVQAPDQVEPRAGVGGDRGLRLHVLERFREHVHFGAGCFLERRDDGVEGFVFRRHEALPAHQGQLGARFRFPRRILGPGLGPVEQRLAGQRGAGRQRGTALEQLRRVKSCMVSLPVVMFVLLCFRRSAACPWSHRTDGQATDRVSGGSCRPD